MKLLIQIGKDNLKRRNQKQFPRNFNVERAVSVNAGEAVKVTDTVFLR